MKDEWHEYCIGDIADIVGGSTPSTADPSNFDGDIPWLTPRDLSNTHERYVSRGERNLTRKGLASCSAKILPAGTVLLTSRAPIGYLAIAKQPIATNQGFRSLVLKPEFDSEFIYYWLKANIGELERHASGSTFKELNGSALKGIRIRVPNKKTQRAIAHILGSLDDKIELNKRMNETLESMAQAIFKSWFIDFDPVRAKAEGRDPGLPQPIADLFPDQLVDSKLGEIPAGWRVEPFVETIEVIGGGTPKTSVSEYWNGDIPWFSVIDAPLESEVWVIDTEKKISRLGVENSSTRILPVSTTIISARGTVGRVALVGVPMAMNQSCYGLRGKMDSNGFFTYFSTKELVARLRRHAHGSVFDTITRDTLASISFVVPPVEIITTFEGMIIPIMKCIRDRLFESRTLAELRDALLPRLIRGEIRIEDVERFLADRGL